MAMYVIHLYTNNIHQHTLFAYILLSTPQVKELPHMCPYNHPSQNDVSYVHKVSTTTFHLLLRSQLWSYKIEQYKTSTFDSLQQFLHM